MIIISEATHPPRTFSTISLHSLHLRWSFAMNLMFTFQPIQNKLVPIRAKMWYHGGMRGGEHSLVSIGWRWIILQFLVCYIIWFYLLILKIYYSNLCRCRAGFQPRPPRPFSPPKPTLCSINSSADVPRFMEYSRICARCRLTNCCYFSGNSWGGKGGRSCSELGWYCRRLD